MIEEAKPTTPVAPNTATFVPFQPLLNLVRSTRSTQATMAAAVVNEPAGSANVERPNGGTSAFSAASIMSSARMASLPPMNRPVRTPKFGGREKMASCVSAVTSSSVTLM